MRKTLAAIAAAAISVSAFAQAPQPARRDADYYQIWLIDFEEDREEDAMRIISDFFMRADAQSGGTGPDLDMVFLTGGWDMMVGWKLEGGLSYLEWEIPPDDVEWFQALAQLTGGPQQAQQKIREFEDTIARREVLIGYRAR